MYILACGDVHTHERMYTCIYSIHTFVVLDVDMICQDADMICIYVCIPEDPCSTLFATWPMSHLRRDIWHVSPQIAHSFMTTPKKSYMEFYVKFMAYFH